MDRGAGGAVRARFVRWSTGRPRAVLVAQLVGLGLGLMLGLVAIVLMQTGGTLDSRQACSSSRHLTADSHELYAVLADPAQVELVAASLELFPPRAECTWSVAQGTGLVTEHSFGSVRVVGALAGAGYLALVGAAGVIWGRRSATVGS